MERAPVMTEHDVPAADRAVSRSKDHKHDFWNRRAKIAIYWGLILTTSNFVFQVSAILYPANPGHLIQNIVYTVNSVVCLTLFLISLRLPGRTYLAFIASVLTLVRNLIRIYDIEDTFDGMTVADKFTLICS